MATEENHRVAERTEDERTETTIFSEANMLFLFSISSDVRRKTKEPRSRRRTLRGFYDLLLTRTSDEPIEFLNYLAKLYDSSFQPVLKIFIRGIHGNGAAFCAAVVQSDLGKLD